MRDGYPGENIEQHPIQQHPESETVNAPAPPGNPHGQEAQPASNQEVQREVQHIEDRVKSAERWMIGLTAAIAFFGLCAVIVGMFQWNAMKGQLGEMHTSGLDTHDLAVASAKQVDRTKDLVDRMKDQADGTKIIAKQAVVQAQAAQSASETAVKAFTVGNRPWVKIKHRIESPLTFDVGRWEKGKLVALMTIEDTLENVGQSVALNVLHWEDVIPMGDPTSGNVFSTEAAQKRRREWCDASRHLTTETLVGDVLFPRDPLVVHTAIVITMEDVAKATVKNGDLASKAGFVLVGCVVYKFAFEQSDAPTHQTRFFYWLGIPREVGFTPFILTRGVADGLRLISFPINFSVD